VYFLIIGFVGTADDMWNPLILHYEKHSKIPGKNATRFRPGIGVSFGAPVEVASVAGRAAHRMTSLIF